MEHFNAGLRSVLQDIAVPNKLQVILLVTLAYSYVALQITLLVEAFFRLILSMPDNWFKVLKIKNKDPDRPRVKITLARTEHSNITNKMLKPTKSHI